MYKVHIYIVLHSMYVYSFMQSSLLALASLSSNKEDIRMKVCVYKYMYMYVMYVYNVRTYMYIHVHISREERVSNSIYRCTNTLGK